MTKKNLIFVFFACFSFALQTKGAPTDSTLQQLSSVVASLKDSLKALSGTVSKIKIADTKNTGGDKAIASSIASAVAEWKKNAQKKYSHTFGDNNWILALSLASMLALFWFIGKASALCRDESFEISSSGQKVLKQVSARPFSYSKVQLAWWTFVIFSCYAASCLYFKELMPLNQTMIILLGGGIAVTVFGKVIDSNQIQKDTVLPVRHQDLDPTKGFWTDILSDENGVSVSRLQSVLFNFIFGIGFIASCFGNFDAQVYPFIDFDLWQFALLGISATGYLGLKAGDNSQGTLPARLAMATANKNTALAAAGR